MFVHWKPVMFHIVEHVRKKVLKIPKNWNLYHCPGQSFRSNLLRDREKSSIKWFILINWLICLQGLVGNKVALWSLSFYVIASHLTSVNMLKTTHRCASKKEMITQESQDTAWKTIVPLNYSITTILLEVF